MRINQKFLFLLFYINIVYSQFNQFIEEQQFNLNNITFDQSIGFQQYFTLNNYQNILLKDNNQTIDVSSSSLQDLNNFREQLISQIQYEDINTQSRTNRYRFNLNGNRDGNNKETQREFQRRTRQNMNENNFNDENDKNNKNNKNNRNSNKIPTVIKEKLQEAEELIIKLETDIRVSNKKKDKDVIKCFISQMLIGTQCVSRCLEDECFLILKAVNTCVKKSVNILADGQNLCVPQSPEVQEYCRQQGFPGCLIYDRTTGSFDCDQTKFIDENQMCQDKCDIDNNQCYKQLDNGNFICLDTDIYPAFGDGRCRVEQSQIKECIDRESGLTGCYDNVLKQCNNLQIYQNGQCEQKCTHVPGLCALFIDGKELCIQQNEEVTADSNNLCQSVDPNQVQNCFDLKQHIKGCLDSNDVICNIYKKQDEDTNTCINKCQSGFCIRTDLSTQIQDCIPLQTDIDGNDIVFAIDGQCNQKTYDQDISCQNIDQTQFGCISAGNQLCDLTMFFDIDSRKCQPKCDLAVSCIYTKNNEDICILRDLNNLDITNPNCVSINPSSNNICFSSTDHQDLTSCLNMDTFECLVDQYLDPDTSQCVQKCESNYCVQMIDDVQYCINMFDDFGGQILNADDKQVCTDFQEDLDYKCQLFYNGQLQVDGCISISQSILSCNIQKSLQDNLCKERCNYDISCIYISSIGLENCIIKNTNGIFTLTDDNFCQNITSNKDYQCLAKIDDEYLSACFSSSKQRCLANLQYNINTNQCSQKCQSSQCILIYDSLIYCINMFENGVRVISADSNQYCVNFDDNVNYQCNVPLSTDIGCFDNGECSYTKFYVDGNCVDKCDLTNYCIQTINTIDTCILKGNGITSADGIYCDNYDSTLSYQCTNILSEVVGCIQEGSVCDETLSYQSGSCSALCDYEKQCLHIINSNNICVSLGYQSIEIDSSDFISCLNFDPIKNYACFDSQADISGCLLSGTDVCNLQYFYSDTDNQCYQKCDFSQQCIAFQETQQVCIQNNQNDIQFDNTINFQNTLCRYYYPEEQYQCSMIDLNLENVDAYSGCTNKDEFFCDLSLIYESSTETCVDKCDYTDYCLQLFENVPGNQACIQLNQHGIFIEDYNFCGDYQDDQNYVCKTPYNGNLQNDILGCLFSGETYCDLKYQVTSGICQIKCDFINYCLQQIDQQQICVFKTSGLILSADGILCDNYVDTNHYPCQQFQQQLSTTLVDINLIGCLLPGTNICQFQYYFNTNSLQCVQKCPTNYCVDFLSGIEYCFNMFDQSTIPVQILTVDVNGYCISFDPNIVQQCYNIQLQLHGCYQNGICNVSLIFENNQCVTKCDDFNSKQYCITDTNPDICLEKLSMSESIQNICDTSTLIDNDIYPCIDILYQKTGTYVFDSTQNIDCDYRYLFDYDNSLSIDKCNYTEQCIMFYEDTYFCIHVSKSEISQTNDICSVNPINEEKLYCYNYDQQQYGCLQYVNSVPECNIQYYFDNDIGDCVQKCDFANYCYYFDNQNEYCINYQNDVSGLAIDSNTMFCTNFFIGDEYECKFTNEIIDSGLINDILGCKPFNQLYCDFSLNFTLLPLQVQRQCNQKCGDFTYQSYSQYCIQNYYTEFCIEQQLGQNVVQQISLSNNTCDQNDLINDNSYVCTDIAQELFGCTTIDTSQQNQICDQSKIYDSVNQICQDICDFNVFCMEKKQRDKICIQNVQIIGFKSNSQIQLAEINQFCQGYDITKNYTCYENQLFGCISENTYAICDTDYIMYNGQCVKKCSDIDIIQYCKYKELIHFCVYQESNSLSILTEINFNCQGYVDTYSYKCSDIFQQVDGCFQYFLATENDIFCDFSKKFESDSCINICDFPNGYCMYKYYNRQLCIKDTKDLSTQLCNAVVDTQNYECQDIDTQYLGCIEKDESGILFCNTNKYFDTTNQNCVDKCRYDQNYCIHFIDAIDFLCVSLNQGPQTITQTNNVCDSFISSDEQQCSKPNYQFEVIIGCTTLDNQCNIEKVLFPGFGCVQKCNKQSVDQCLLSDTQDTCIQTNQYEPNLVIVAGYCSGFIDQKSYICSDVTEIFFGCFTFDANDLSTLQCDFSLYFNEAEQECQPKCMLNQNTAQNARGNILGDTCVVLHGNNNFTCVDINIGKNVLDTYSGICQKLEIQQCYSQNGLQDGCFDINTDQFLCDHTLLYQNNQCVQRCFNTAFPNNDIFCANLREDEKDNFCVQMNSTSPHLTQNTFGICNNYVNGQSYNCTNENFTRFGCFVYSSTNDLQNVCDYSKMLNESTNLCMDKCNYTGGYCYFEQILPQCNIQQKYQQYCIQTNQNLIFCNKQTIDAITVQQFLCTYIGQNFTGVFQVNRNLPFYNLQTKKNDVIPIQYGCNLGLSPGTLPETSRGYCQPGQGFYLDQILEYYCIISYSFQLFARRYDSLIIQSQYDPQFLQQCTFTHRQQIYFYDTTTQYYLCYKSRISGFTYHGCMSTDNFRCDFAKTLFQGICQPKCKNQYKIMIINNRELCIVDQLLTFETTNILETNPNFPYDPRKSYGCHIPASQTSPDSLIEGCILPYTFRCEFDFQYDHVTQSCMTQQQILARNCNNLQYFNKTDYQCYDKCNYLTQCLLIDGISESCQSLNLYLNETICKTRKNHLPQSCTSSSVSGCITPFTTECKTYLQYISSIQDCDFKCNAILSLSGRRSRQCYKQNSVNDTCFFIGTLTSEDKAFYDTETSECIYTEENKKSAVECRDLKFSREFNSYQFGCTTLQSDTCYFYQTMGGTACINIAPTADLCAYDNPDLQIKFRISIKTSLINTVKRNNDTDDREFGKCINTTFIQHVQCLNRTYNLNTGHEGCLLEGNRRGYCDVDKDLVNNVCIHRFRESMTNWRYHVIQDVSSVNDDPIGRCDTGTCLAFIDGYGPQSVGASPADFLHFCFVGITVQIGTTRRCDNVGYSQSMDKGCVVIYSRSTSGLTYRTGCYNGIKQIKEDQIFCNLRHVLKSGKCEDRCDFTTRWYRIETNRCDLICLFGSQCKFDALFNSVTHTICLTYNGTQGDICDKVQLSSLACNHPHSRISGCYLNLEGQRCQIDLASDGSLSRCRLKCPSDFCYYNATDGYEADFFQVCLKQGDRSPINIPTSQAANNIGIQNTRLSYGRYCNNYDPQYAYICRELSGTFASVEGCLFPFSERCELRRFYDRTNPAKCVVKCPSTYFLHLLNNNEFCIKNGTTYVVSGVQASGITSNAVTVDVECYDYKLKRYGCFSKAQQACLLGADLISDTCQDKCPTGTCYHLQYQICISNIIGQNRGVCIEQFFIGQIPCYNLQNNYYGCTQNIIQGNNYVQICNTTLIYDQKMEQCRPKCNQGQCFVENNQIGVQYCLSRFDSRNPIGPCTYIPTTPVPCLLYSQYNINTFNGFFGIYGCSQQSVQSGSCRQTHVLDGSVCAIRYHDTSCLIDYGYSLFALSKANVMTSSDNTYCDKYISSPFFFSCRINYDFGCQYPSPVPLCDTSQMKSSSSNICQYKCTLPTQAYDTIGQKCAILCSGNYCNINRRFCIMHNPNNVPGNLDSCPLGYLEINSAPQNYRCFYQQNSNLQGCMQMGTRYCNFSQYFDNNQCVQKCPEGYCYINNRNGDTCLKINHYQYQYQNLYIGETFGQCTVSIDQAANFICYNYTLQEEGCLVNIPSALLLYCDTNKTYHYGRCFERCRYPASCLEKSTNTCVLVEQDTYFIMPKKYNADLTCNFTRSTYPLSYECIDRYTGIQGCQSRNNQNCDYQQKYDKVSKDCDYKCSTSQCYFQINDIEFCINSAVKFLPAINRVCDMQLYDNKQDYPCFNITYGVNGCLDSKAYNHLQYCNIYRAFDTVTQKCVDACNFNTHCLHFEQNSRTCINMQDRFGYILKYKDGRCNPESLVLEPTVLQNGSLLHTVYECQDPESTFEGTYSTHDNPKICNSLYYYRSSTSRRQKCLGMVCYYQSRQNKFCLSAQNTASPYFTNNQGFCQEPTRQTSRSLTMRCYNVFNSTLQLHEHGCARFTNGDWECDFRYSYSSTTHTCSTRRIFDQ